MLMRYQPVERYLGMISDQHAGMYIHASDIPRAILECLDDPGKSEELTQVAEILAGKLDWHDAELVRLAQWFDTAQELTSDDHSLAKAIYECLGWTVPRSIIQGITAQAKEEKP